MANTNFRTNPVQNHVQWIFFDPKGPLQWVGWRLLREEASEPVYAPQQNNVFFFLPPSISKKKERKKKENKDDFYTTMTVLIESRDDIPDMDTMSVNIVVNACDPNEISTARFARPVTPPPAAADARAGAVLVPMKEDGKKKEEEEEVVFLLRKIGQKNQLKRQPETGIDDNAWGNTAVYTWPPVMNQEDLFGNEESVSSDSARKEPDDFDVIRPHHQPDAANSTTRDRITDASRVVLDKVAKGVNYGLNKVKKSKPDSETSARINDASRAVLESLAYGIDKVKEMTPDNTTSTTNNNNNTYSESLLKPIHEDFWDDDDFFSSDDFPDFSGSVNYFSSSTTTQTQWKTTTDREQPEDDDNLQRNLLLPDDIKGLKKVMQIDMCYGEMEQEDDDDQDSMEDAGLNETRPVHRRNGHRFVGSRLACLQVFTHAKQGGTSEGFVDSTKDCMHSLTDAVNHDLTMAKESELGQTCSKVPDEAAGCFKSFTEDVSYGIVQVGQGIAKARESDLSNKTKKEESKKTSFVLTKEDGQKESPVKVTNKDELDHPTEGTVKEESTAAVDVSYSMATEGDLETVKSQEDESSPKKPTRVGRLKSLRILRESKIFKSLSKDSSVESTTSDLPAIENNPQSRDDDGVTEETNSDERVSPHPLKQSIPAMRLTLRDMMNRKRVLTLPDHRRDQSTFEDSQEVRLETFLLHNRKKSSNKVDFKKVFSNPGGKKSHRRNQTTFEASHEVDLESYGESREDANDADGLARISSLFSSYVPSQHIRNASNTSGYTSGSHTRSSSGTHTRSSSTTSGTYTSGSHSRSSSNNTSGTYTSSSGRSLTLLGTFEFSSTDGSSNLPPSLAEESVGPLEILFEHFAGPESDGSEGTPDTDGESTRESSAKVSEEPSSGSEIDTLYQLPKDVESSIFSSYLNFIAKTFDLERIYGEGFEMDTEKNMIEWDDGTRESSELTPGSHISQLTDDRFFIKRRLV